LTLLTPTIQSATIDWFGFGAAILLIELTPGPNMAWLAGLTLTDGKRAGLAATVGIAIGLALNAALAALGLAALIALDHSLQHILRWAGAGFMLVLAVLSWRDGNVDVARPVAAQRNFGAGIVLNLLNPKAFLLFILVVPPFLSGGKLAISQALTLAGISVSIATAVHLVIVAMAAQGHSWVSSARRTQLVRRVMALVMVCVAAWFLFE
jgi:threonine/homoserine/homoserine lactone efflux protein